MAKTRFRKSDGRWVATVEVASASGKRKRRWFYGATKREAEQKRYDAIAREGGTLGAANVGTVAELMKSWLAEVERSKEPTTAALYHGLWARHGDARLGKKRLWTFTSDDVSQFYDELLAANVGRATISKLRVVMHRAFHVAKKKRKFVGDNPWGLVEAPRYRAQERNVLSVEQARRLITAAFESADRYAMAAVLAMACGMRWGEIFGLKWSDVTWAANALTIRRSLQQVGKRFSFSEGKTATARRKISLHTIAMNALERRKQIAERVGPDDLVFTTTVGTPVDRNVFRNRHFVPLLTAAGVPIISFHELRHSFATLQLQLGQPTKVISEILGHSNPAITVRIYQHVLDDMHDAAMRAIDGALRG